MKYVWILESDHDQVLAIFNQPQLALESLLAIGPARVIARTARCWHLELRGDVLFKCVRRRVQTTPASLGNRE